MKYQLIGKSDIFASRVSLGLMRIANKSLDEAVEIIKKALSLGINFFDHADIYGDGKCEKIFSEAMKKINIARDKYYLQSKVGIKVKKSYNFSFEHIIKSVDEILERLNTTYLDSLLLHRADILWEPEEIARAFKVLKDSRKVKNFGVSNMNQFQISFLQSKLDFPIITNQLQFSIMHADMVSSGILVNSNLQVKGFNAIGIMDYLREKEITIQAYSPFQFGRYEGVYIDNEKFPVLNEKLEEFSLKYKSSKIGIALSWILRHPANIQVIIGTMNLKRIEESVKSLDVELSRDDWYELFIAAGNDIL